MEDSGTPKYHDKSPLEPRKINSVELGGNGDASGCYDDDGRLKRTGEETLHLQLFKSLQNRVLSPLMM